MNYLTVTRRLDLNPESAWGPRPTSPQRYRGRGLPFLGLGLPPRSAGPVGQEGPDSFLHAAELEFAHPITRKVLRLNAPLPAELEQFVALLESDAPVAAPTAKTVRKAHIE